MHSILLFFLQFRELTTEHQRLAEIIEMIHTASLIHDDVIDDSGMRRGTYHSITNKSLSINIAVSFLFILVHSLLETIYTYSLCLAECVGFFCFLPFWVVHVLWTLVRTNWPIYSETHLIIFRERNYSSAIWNTGGCTCWWFYVCTIFLVSCKPWKYWSYKAHQSGNEEFEQVFVPSLKLCMICIQKGASLTGNQGFCQWWNKTSINTFWLWHHPWWLPAQELLQDRFSDCSKHKVSCHI